MREWEPRSGIIEEQDEQTQAWCSESAPLSDLPEEIREVFERTGCGCLAAETNVGVVHVCHAADVDIEGFRGKPVLYQWQLIKMPTAPIIRLEMAILDHPANPYVLESFLNVAQEDQFLILAQLASQDRLYLAFYGDDFDHRFTKIVRHDEQQWEYLDDLVAEAVSYWDQIPSEQWSYSQAKAEFVRRFPLGGNDIIPPYARTRPVWPGHSRCRGDVHPLGA
jgi:hypothetical protein